MKIQYTFKGMQHWEEVRVKEYAELKERSLEKLLTHFQDDEVKLEVRSERFDKNNAYEVELTMEIPGKVMVGKEASHSIEKALDLAKDRLIGQLRKHEDVLKSKGKTSSGMKRAIKEMGENREHGSIKQGATESSSELSYESALSSDTDSKPMKTA